ncbi:ATP-binding protein [Streptomyces bohaiensis]|uniref:ATP-binding protein n=1 Tax=Streptomyces bohaiensis TaxID=1431344 RepID=A0ABX1CBM2_9ACTN|nr:ATP-binding protein [Streptomyces bohaiensis]NJQ14602.1 ATP-binding protein [Streptomyces bohaiensis]
MKHGTVKTLGAAAVGAAFAVAAAGTASAATDQVGQVAGDVLGSLSVTDALPVDQVTTLAADAPLSQVLPSSQEDLLNSAGQVVSEAASNPTKVTQDPTSLLGGLPLDSVVI